MSAVAVVLAAYNPNAAWLRESIDSVIHQVGAADRLLVVDDGSDERIVAAVRIEHAGIGPASNAGIAFTNAPLIARLDADDRMMPGTISLLRRYLEAHPQVDVVSGAMHYIRPNGSRFGTVRPPVMHASPKHRNHIVHSGCMFRRELWERVGGYPDMKYADWHFWEACEAAGAKFSVLDHYVIERRVHPDSFSFSHSKHLQAEWKRANA